MLNLNNTISKVNATQLVTDYLASVQDIGASIAGLKGLRLLEALKRDPVGSGPYPRVALFEAANRIMTDLVILCGIKWLLSNDVFPFACYSVEFGTEDEEGFDIRASRGDKTLVGEAFNVAPSFFQTKKTKMLKKLREPSVQADYKIIVCNHDAVTTHYIPKPRPEEFFVFVNIGTGDSYMVPDKKIKAIH
jgi:hypothetical protein